MQNESCAECIAAMERVRGELLARLACANCQHCQKAPEDVAQRPQELAGCRLLGVRCSQCGKCAGRSTDLPPTAAGPSGGPTIDAPTNLNGHFSGLMAGFFVF